VRRGLAAGEGGSDSKKRANNLILRTLGPSRDSSLSGTWPQRRRAVPVPEAERTRWQKLWTDVAATLHRAAAKAAPQKGAERK